MNILFQTLHHPLKLKYQCQRQTTWKLAINSLITILGKGLPVAYKDTRTGVNIYLFLARVLINATSKSETSNFL